MADGSWQSAVGGWQLAVGGWRQRLAKMVTATVFCHGSVFGSFVGEWSNCGVASVITLS